MPQLTRPAAMYAPPPRLSILQRPLRPEGGQANLENADRCIHDVAPALASGAAADHPPSLMRVPPPAHREHEKVQARIAAKAAKREEYEERLVEAYYPTAEARRRAA